MNRIKNQEVEQQQENVAKPIKKNSNEGLTRKFINAINVFSYFDRKSIVQFMPFVFFLTAWAILYIANSFVAERTIRDIDKTEREIKELRSEFITAKSDLMYRSKLSEVARAIETQGLKEARIAPKKILLQKTTRSAEE